jgi:hypothetical protein
MRVAAVGKVLVISIYAVGGKSSAPNRRAAFASEVMPGCEDPAKSNNQISGDILPSS